MDNEWEEVPLGIKFHGMGAGKHFQGGAFGELRLIDSGDLHLVEKQGVLDADDFRLFRRDQADRTQTDLHGLLVGLKIHGDRALFQTDGGDAVHIGDRIVNLVHKSFRRQIGKAKADGIAAGVLCKIPDKDPFNLRRMGKNSQNIPIPAGHIGVHPGPAHIFSNFVHDQEINLVKGKLGQHFLSQRQQFRFSLFNFFGSQGGDDGGFIIPIFDDSQAATMIF